MKPTSCQLSFFFTSLFAMNIMSRAVSEESMTYNQYHSFLHNHHGKRNKSKTVTPNKNTKFYLGTCTDDFKDEQRTKVIEEHFTSLTTANVLKWDTSEKEQGKFSFEAADKIVEFAKAHDDMVVRLHTITWHRQCPSWVSQLDSEALKKAVTNHIETMLKHFDGKAYSLDVCNEIFEDDGSYRNSFWYKTLGETYPEMILKAARKVGSAIKLYINDFSVEGINKKSDALYKLAQDLKSKDLLDGVGFQSHLIVKQVPKDMAENLKRFTDLDLEVAISELDVRMKLPPSEEDLKQQAEDFGEVTTICKSNDKCVGMTIWGVGYKDSWIPQEFPGMGAALLFDENYKPTAAFEAVQKALGSK